MAFSQKLKILLLVSYSLIIEIFQRAKKNLNGHSQHYIFYARMPFLHNYADIKILTI